MTPSTMILKVWSITGRRWETMTSNILAALCLVNRMPTTLPVVISFLSKLRLCMSRRMLNECRRR